MFEADIQTVLIVGAGFSSNAGLPLTSDFTDAMLAARQFGSGPSRMIVDFLSEFIYDTFSVSRRAKAEDWPDLEEIFTCVDMSANSGHHLGGTFAPADLRTVRRALLSRIVRMLDQRYRAARREKGPAWLSFERFFSELDLVSTGFISMNWDTVIERKLALSQGRLRVDYGCDAIPAHIPDPPDPESFSSVKAYQKEISKHRSIIATAPEEQLKKFQGGVPLIKIHGSANWLYCDNCRQLFWVHPDQSECIARQLIRPDDISRIAAFLKSRGKDAGSTMAKLKLQPPVRCQCSRDVVLGSRIATFSYRKALDFPMFQKSWFAAEHLLRNAKKWVFIGYSLPAADYEFKYLLKRTQLSRRDPPQIMVVSGGTAKGVRLAYKHYRTFFGRALTKTSFFGKGTTDDVARSIRTPAIESAVDLVFP